MEWLAYFPVSCHCNLSTVWDLCNVGNLILCVLEIGVVAGGVLQKDDVDFWPDVAWYLKDY